jgi:hypothetical protein
MKTFEVGLYGLEEILTGAAAAMDGQKMAREAITVVDAARDLFNRMRDPQRPGMLCMSCDHVFAHDEPPCEVAVGVPRDETSSPVIASPVCARCAEADDETKIRRLKKIWLPLFPSGQILAIEANGTA